MPETPGFPEEPPLADDAAVTAEARAFAHEGESPEAARVPETAKEHDPMLDVHPAHHAASTWKEFFIHIATICIGLLIAVCLEQGVEAIHRAHERSDLIEAFRAECETNVKGLQSIVNNTRANVAYVRQVIAELRALSRRPASSPSSSPPER